MPELRKCALCRNEAVNWVRWGGTNRTQEALLCEDHVRELWSRVGPLCSLNLMHFTIDAASANGG